MHKQEHKNIFDTPNDVAIVIPVNTIGKFNFGMAEVAGALYPDLNLVYKTLVDEHLIKKGRPLIVNANGRQFILLPIKTTWNERLKLSTLMSNMEALVDMYDKHKKSLPTKIAFPRLFAYGNTTLQKALDVVVQQYLDGIDADTMVFG